MLQDHFRHRKKGPHKLPSGVNYARLPRSRSNTSSTFATSSHDSALGTEVDSNLGTTTKVIIEN